MPSEDLLRQLFVKKSLKNNDSGFQLSIANPLSDATLIEPAKVAIKGETVDEKYKDTIEVEVAGKKFKNTDISQMKPFKFAVKSEATLYIKRDQPLPVDKYKLTFSFLSEEYGELKFSMKERIKE